MLASRLTGQATARHQSKEAAKVKAKVKANAKAEAEAEAGGFSRQAEKENLIPAIFTAKTPAKIKSSDGSDFLHMGGEKSAKSKTGNPLERLKLAEVKNGTPRLKSARGLKNATPTISNINATPSIIATKTGQLKSKSKSIANTLKRNPTKLSIKKNNIQIWKDGEISNNVTPSAARVPVSDVKKIEAKSILKKVKASSERDVVEYAPPNTLHLLKWAPTDPDHRIDFDAIDFTRSKRYIPNAAASCVRFEERESGHVGLMLQVGGDSVGGDRDAVNGSRRDSLDLKLDLKFDPFEFIKDFC